MQAVQAAQVNVALSTGDGAKTIYVKLVDDAGNISTTKSCVTILDTMPPTAPVLVNQSGRVSAATTSVPITIATPAKDANFASYQVQGGQYQSWTNVQPPISFQIGAAGTWNLLQVRAVDLAGNVSTAVQLQIYRGDQTILPATVIGSHLTAAYSPYIVHYQGSNYPYHFMMKNLMIDAGVVIDVDPYVALDLSGNFAVNGTSAAHVTMQMTPGASGPGYWGGILLNDPNNNATITYLDLLQGAFEVIGPTDSAPTGVFTIANSSLYAVDVVNFSRVTLTNSSINCGGNSSNTTGLSILNGATPSQGVFTGTGLNIATCNTAVSVSHQGPYPWTINISDSNLEGGAWNVLTDLANVTYNLANNYWGYSGGDVTNSNFSGSTPISGAASKFKVLNEQGAAVTWSPYSQSPISGTGPQ